MTASRSRSLTHLCRISTPSSQQKMHCKQPPTCRMLLNQGQPGTRSPQCMLPLVLVPRPEIGPLLMNARWGQLFGWAQNLLCTQTSSWRPYLRKCPKLTPPSFSASATVLSSHCFSVLETWHAPLRDESHLVFYLWSPGRPPIILSYGRLPPCVNRVKPAQSEEFLLTCCRR